MQNISALFQNFFNPASKFGDKYVEMTFTDQPQMKSLQIGDSSSETDFMSKAGRNSPQKNSVGTHFDQRSPESNPPTYQAPAFIATTSPGNVRNLGCTSTGNLKEASRIAVDVFFQYIQRNEISLLQSDIEAGFKCDDTYKVGGKSMTPFQYAMWQGNVDAMKVLLPHTSRNYVVLAFLEAHEASFQELVKILPAAKEILATLKPQSDWKYPVAQCANFIERIEARNL
jgi:hypothetical protein